jgi:hypothetical protein
MTSLATFNAVLQVIAAFLIFVASYLVLLLFIIIGLLIAELIHEGVRLGRAYTVKCSSLDDGLASEIKGNAPGSRRLRHIFQH